MAIVSRAERGTDFAINTTPSVVGPGSYQQSNKGSVKPNFAGFGSSKPKTDQKASNNPGPGSYLSTSGTSLQKHSSTKGSNSFTTAVSRLAPICPGSTPFQTSSNASCPGPGTYDFEPAIKIKKTRVPPKKPVVASRLVVAPDYNPPAVPSTLSKGPFVAVKGFTDVSSSTSVNTNDQGQLRVQVKPTPSNTEIYSGLESDTVGPAVYNPNHKTIVPDLAAAQVSFSRSQTKRELGQLSVGPTSKLVTPGPGSYDQPSSLSIVPKPPIQGVTGFNPGHDEKDAPIGRSSFFASSAPRVGIIGNGTSQPGGGGGLGPGSYVGSGGVGDTLMRDNRWHEKQTRQAQVAFGSEMPRNATFLGSSKQAKPGPGQYGTRSDFDFEAPYTLVDRPVGFASSGARSCIPDAPELVVRTSKSAPGPGYYDIDAVDGIANGVDTRRKQSLGRQGVFGTCGERFKMYDLPPSLGGGMDGPRAINPGGGLGGSGGFMPGPGSYDPQLSISDSAFLDKPQRSSSRSMGQSGGGGGDMAQTMLRGEGGQSSPVRNQGRLLRTHLGTYARLPQAPTTSGDVLGGYSLKKNGQVVKKDTPPPIPDYNPRTFDEGGSVGIWSKSTNARFSDKKILDKVIPKTPGPSRYQTTAQTSTMVPRKSSNSNTSLSKSHRFDEPRRRGASLGPGSYDTSQKWVKKSYNVTYVPAK